MKRVKLVIVLFFVAASVSDLSAKQIFQRRINQWKNNKYDGLWISWSDTSGKKVESKGRYRDGHEVGVWKFYYEDGTLRRRERYSKSGIATKYFYPNGKIKSKGKAVLDYEEKLLHYFYQGEWIYYSEDGKPNQIITYERGKEISQRKIENREKEISTNK